MTAYLVAAIDVQDEAGYAPYRDAVPALVAAHGGRYLVRGGAMTVQEGNWPGARTVVMAFPDRAAAEAFYASADYQAIIGVRRAASTGSVIIVDGIAGP